MLSKRAVPLPVVPHAVALMGAVHIGASKAVAIGVLPSLRNDADPRHGTIVNALVYLSRHRRKPADTIWAATTTKGVEEESGACSPLRPRFSPPVGPDRDNGDPLAGSRSTG